MFIDVALSPLSPIFKPIVDIGIALVKLTMFLIELIKILPKIVNLFIIFTDPAKVIKDIFFGLFTGVYMVLEATLDMIFGDMYRAMGGEVDEGGNSGSMDEGSKCIPPSMVKLILLVLCPPLAVMLEVGLAGLLYVLICCFLTYFFYFPGLIYGSLFVLC
jgi:uncharacterized membrane protein YqaE (UPF0057 family)